MRRGAKGSSSRQHESERIRLLTARDESSFTGNRLDRCADGCGLVRSATSSRGAVSSESLLLADQTIKTLTCNGPSAHEDYGVVVFPWCSRMSASQFVMTMFGGLRSSNGSLRTIPLSATSGAITDGGSAFRSL